VNDPSLAFIATPQTRPGLEIRVNFGMFAGREATAAEIDDLANALVPEVDEVTIVAEQRHELSDDVEASVHQVRVEIEEAQLPEDVNELSSLADRLVEACDRWARRAIDTRHVDV
jgi:methionyl-tRNA synthetase